MKILFTLLLCQALPVFSSTFQQQCIDVKSGVTNRYSYYYKGFCYVRPEAGTSFSNALTLCTHMPNGRLAVVTETHIAQTIYNNLYVGNSITHPYIALRQMDTSSEPSDGWMWVDVGRQAPINKTTTLWNPGEPNNKYGATTGAHCGRFTANPGVHDEQCSSGGYLCQYPEPTKKRLFKSFLRDYKANNESYIWNAVQNVRSSTNCGTLCSHQPTTVCMSYAYSYVDQICELYWLPANAMNIEYAQNYVLWETILS